jgi:hypothetical protein
MVESVKLAVEQMRHFTVSQPFATVLELEQTATRVLQVQPWHVPGVLQVSAYASALLSAITGKAPDDADVQERVALRTARGEAFLRRLDAENPPTLSVVIDDAVLLPPGVSPTVMREQLDYLLEVMDRYPSVHLAVQSLASAGYAEARACEVFERGDAVEAVFFESSRYDDLTTDLDAGQKYRDLVTSLLTAAKTEEKTSAKIARIRDSR